MSVARRAKGNPSKRSREQAAKASKAKKLPRSQLLNALSLQEEKCSQLRKKLAKVTRERRLLRLEWRQLVEEKRKVDLVNAQLHAIIERGPEIQAPKSGYRSSLADAASKATNAWPLLPGSYEHGRRR